jgi:N utilization substance protein B
MIAANLSAARLAAVQALYQIDLGGGSMEDALLDFLSERGNETVDAPDDKIAIPPDQDLFAEIVRGVWARREELANMIGAALVDGWPLKRLEIVLRCILEAGVYELLARTSVPVRVVIDEYVDLAHAFYAGAEPGMVNGVLDTLAHRLRPDEFDNANPKAENGGQAAETG